jgi:hypothetical protein
VAAASLVRAQVELSELGARHRRWRSLRLLHQEYVRLSVGGRDGSGGDDGGVEISPDRHGIAVASTFL